MLYEKREDSSREKTSNEKYETVEKNLPNKILEANNLKERLKTILEKAIITNEDDQ